MKRDSNPRTQEGAGLQPADFAARRIHAEGDQRESNPRLQNHGLTSSPLDHGHQVKREKVPPARRVPVPARVATGESGNGVMGVAWELLSDWMGQWRGPESNRRSSAYETEVGPSRPARVDLVGLEPTASCLQGRRSPR